MANIIIQNIVEQRALTSSQHSLLVQIVARKDEYAYMRRPIGADVVTLVERGYLEILNHNGYAVLKPTGAGYRMVERGFDVVA